MSEKCCDAKGPLVLFEAVCECWCTVMFVTVTLSPHEVNVPPMLHAGSKGAVRAFPLVP